MSQRIVPLQVDDEHVKGAGVNLGAAGSHDAVVLELHFSQLWDELAKTVYWNDAHGAPAGFTIIGGPGTREIDANTYQVAVPASPLQYPGKMSMTIAGAYIDTTVDPEVEKVKALTEAAYFRVMESLSDALSASTINPDAKDQLQQEIDANKVITDDHFKDAAYNADTHTLTLVRENELNDKQVVITPTVIGQVYDPTNQKFYKLYVESGRLVMEEV